MSWAKAIAALIGGIIATAGVAVIALFPEEVAITIAHGLLYATAIGLWFLFFFVSCGLIRGLIEGVASHWRTRR